MDSKVKASSSGLADMGSRTEAASEAADGAESKFIGFVDSLSGAQGIMQGFTDSSLTMSERLAVIGQGAADLAGGMANFLIPALGGMWQKIVSSTAATWALSAAQTAWSAVTKGAAIAMGVLNAVMRANPIMTVITIIALLVAGFMVLWNRSAGFRDFFIGMWKGIQSVVGGVVDWIKGAWNGVVGFFSGLPKRIGDALGAIGGFFRAAFKGAVNVAIDVINWFIDRANDLIYGINIVNPFDDIPSIPHLKRMHSGGVVGGSPGSEQLRILQAGEEVTPRGRAGAGGTVTFAGDTDSAVAQLIMGLFNRGEIRFG
jgi:phage-related protein